MTPVGGLACCNNERPAGGNGRVVSVTAETPEHIS